MTLQVLLLVLGFVMLIKGADWLVDGASALAKKINISDLAIGLTIVAFGTSTPELVVNTLATYDNHHDIVFGNVIGSNILNLFIILGVTGLVAPLVVKSSTVWKEIPFSFLAIVILFLLTNEFFLTENHIFSRIDGLIFLLLFVIFLIYVYKQLKTDIAEINLSTKTYSGFKVWSFIILGLAGLIVGGKLVVNNAVHIATTVGMSEKLIGLTVVALGTSMPELATSITATIKKNTDIAVGNIIGSNIFNISLVLPVCSFLSPITYNRAFNTDVLILAGGTIFLFVAMFSGMKKKLDRWEAGLLVLFYIGYVLYMIYK